MQPEQMSIVSRCEVVDCAYNRNGNCEAIAITIGHGSHPACDTYFKSSQHTKAETQAGVGACKVINCEYNRDFLCSAGSIEVGHGDDPADCLTFEERSESKIA